MRYYIIGWRDFYTHVMAAFPHVSMGRPFQEKYADIRWETNKEHFEAWKNGMTGYPIVDAVSGMVIQGGVDADRFTGYATTESSWYSRFLNFSYVF
jgi:deoxyribodipyrimidine photolyase